MPWPGATALLILSSKFPTLDKNCKLLTLYRIYPPRIDLNGDLWLITDLNCGLLILLTVVSNFSLFIVPTGQCFIVAVGCKVQHRLCKSTPGNGKQSNTFKGSNKWRLYSCDEGFSLMTEGLRIPFLD